MGRPRRRQDADVGHGARSAAVNDDHCAGAWYVASATLATVLEQMETSP
jgi:hypothetical protein